MSEKKELKAIKKGNFKEVFGIDVEYFILDDDKKSVVISQREMGRAIKLIKKQEDAGSRIKTFIGSNFMSNFIGKKTIENLDKYIVFTALDGGKNRHGFSVDILIDICNAIIKASLHDDNILKNYKETAQQAQIIVNACAKSGITNIAYALAGYRPEIHEILEGFKRFLVEEIARAYEKTFPVELYLEWAKIYNFPLKAGKNFNVKCRWLTIDNVYRPLARSNGKILEMLKDKKASDIHGSNKKLFQYLNEEVGTVELKKHLSSLLTIAKLAKGNRTKYENDFAEIFGGQLQFDFDALDREDALNEAKNNKTTQEILKDYPDLFNQDDKDFDDLLNKIANK